MNLGETIIFNEILSIKNAYSTSCTDAMYLNHIINIQTHTLLGTLLAMLSRTQQKFQELTIKESCVDDATKRCKANSNTCKPVEERSCHLGISKPRE